MNYDRRTDIYRVGSFPCLFFYELTRQYMGVLLLEVQFNK
jgi:hypothetical protein